MNHVHTSKNYETELEHLRTRVLTMGGRVEAQVRQAVLAYGEGDIATANHVIAVEHDINREHRDLDAFCTEVIARRQPAAKDLRLLLGVIRAISDLERIADQAAKIAKLVLRGEPRGMLPRVHMIFQSAESANTMIRAALDALAREDSEKAREVLNSDAELDAQYVASMRQLITYMMEDPRTISQALDDIWVAKAIERMGDHAENIAEVAIYIIEGEDVRYSSSMNEPVVNIDTGSDGDSNASVNSAQ